MEAWKVNKWWEEYSPEAIKRTEEIFKKSIEEIKKDNIEQQKRSKLESIDKEIKQEKTDFRTHLTSLVTRVGCAAMFVGGMVSAVCGLALAQDPTIANILQGAGLGALLTGFITPIGLDMTNSQIMKDSLGDDITLSMQARKNIKELKNLKNMIKQDLETSNV